MTTDQKTTAGESRTRPERIVAEVSKNWVEGMPATLGTLGQEFEHVIEVNALRGYALESWQFATVIDPGPRMIVETIVAVFVDVRTLTFTTEGTEEGESRTGS